MNDILGDGWMTLHTQAIYFAVLFVAYQNRGREEMSGMRRMIFTTYLTFSSNAECEHKIRY
jgi:hypothetical protein